MFGLAVMVAALAADAGTSLEIRGETTCPNPDGVRKQLEPLAPRPWPSEAAVKLVVLAEARGDIIVTLFGPALELLEERRLAPYPSCDERARAAAIVVASWLTALPPAAPPTVPFARSAAPTLGRAAAPSAPGRTLSFQASAAALASLSAETVAPGLLVEVALRPRAGRWSLSLGGLLEGQHHKAFGDGQATWWRLGAGAGAAWRAVRGRIWLDLGATFLVTRLAIAGTEFANNTGGATWDVGAAGGMRLGYGSRRVQPWLGAWAVGWGGRQNLYIAGEVAADATRGEIPRLDALFGIGATIGAPGETY